MNALEAPDAPGDLRSASSEGAPEPAPAAGAHPSPDAAPTFRLLVVEDHEDSRELLAEVLRRAGLGGLEIAFARNAEEGILALRSAHFDLVVTDIGLPGVTGLEMLDYARMEGLLEGTTVAIVSGANLWLRQEALARRATFIAKPIDPEDVVGFVAHHAASPARRPQPRAPQGIAA